MPVDKKVVLLKSSPSAIAGEGACPRSGGLWALGKANYKRNDSISQRLSNMPQPCTWPTHGATQGKALGGVVFHVLVHILLFQRSSQLLGSLSLLPPPGRWAWTSFWETLGQGFVIWRKKLHVNRDERPQNWLRAQVWRR